MHSFDTSYKLLAMHDIQYTDHFKEKNNKIHNAKTRNDICAEWELHKGYNGKMPFFQNKGIC